jgi:hypothetical protein
MNNKNNKEENSEMCSRTEEDNISKNIKLSSPMSTK